MVRLLLDMLMQVAWSWTAFVNSASRQGLIRAASSSAGSMYVSNPIPDGEHEKRARLDGSAASVGMLATGGGAIPKEGCRGRRK